MSSSISKKELDRKAILAMAGCFEVEFKFIETFNYSDDPTYQASEQKLERALEYAHILEESENKIVLQHLLIVGTKESPFIVKHWRQDWIYENQDFYFYDRNNCWKYVKKSSEEVQGQWTQKVYQVDDSPRYEGSSSWVHVDGKSFWENKADAPLPRREHTKRDDYNIISRSNRHEIIDGGWIHDQYNHKVVRENGKDDFVLAEEKGINMYKKVDVSKAEDAISWWKENHTFWDDVREYWVEIYGRNTDLILKEEIDGKPLYGHLNPTNEKGIKGVIDGFIELKNLYF